MDLDKELESLEKNPEKELEKMSSNIHDKNQGPSPVNSGPSPVNSGPNQGPNSSNVGSGPKVANNDKPSGPNVKNDETNKVDGNEKASGDKPSNAKSNKLEVDKYESVYNGVVIVGEALISKLKLLFYMPYAFFLYYVPDYLEEKGREKIGRKEGPGIIAGILVMLGFLGIDYLNHSFKFVKYVVVAIAIVICLIDADNSRK